MNGRLKWLAVGLGIILVGSFDPLLASLLGGTSSTLAETPPSAQKLPVTAQFSVKGNTIGLEVARTPEEQSTGLMYRTTLADNRGMLFPLQSPQKVMLWMKNTLIPLDIIFLQNGQVKGIQANVPPCTSDPCPTYGSETPINQMIELPSGRAAELGLKVGDRLNIVFLDKPVKPTEKKKVRQ